MSLKEYNNFIKAIAPMVHPPVNVKDKEKNLNSMMAYDLIRLSSMFKYENLPDSIPQRWLELYLMVNGSCCIAQVNGKMYALVGAFGQEPDAYYMPTHYIVTNPYLKLSADYKIDEDCVILRNDDLYVGLIPLLSKYNSQIAENELSLYMALINTRIQSLIEATTDSAFKSAKKFLEDIEEGKLGAIMGSEFFESLKTLPYATTATSQRITDLIENEQYLKASKLNDLGLNANYNMKRESLNSNESQLNDDMLLPLIDDMLRCRREGVERINDMFGTDIKVDFASSWKENDIERASELLALVPGVEEELIDDNNSDSDNSNNDNIVLPDEAAEGDGIEEESTSEEEEDLPVDDIVEELMQEIENEIIDEEGAEEDDRVSET